MAEEITAITEQKTIVSPEERLGQAGSMVHRGMIWSAGIGLVPNGLVNWAGLLVIQLNMLRKMCKLYGVTYREDLVKKLIGALIGSTAAIPAVGAAMLVRRIPLIGLPLTVASLPIFSAAFTYAVGKVFVQHFESGGTFLTFDPKAVRSYFEEELARGKDVAAATAK